MIRGVVLTLSVVFAAACGAIPDSPDDIVEKIAADRAKDVAKRLAAADAKPDKDTPVAMWYLPQELNEISGLALTANGQMLAHGDERGRIFVINPLTGVVLERFQLKPNVEADLEGITIAGKDAWLVQSNGKLYQFRQGPDGSKVPYVVHDTKLGKECEFEGVMYDPDSAWLVMPCKTVMKKSQRHLLMIYKVRLAGPDSGSISEFSIPLEAVIGSNDWKKFEPSDITLEPTTHNYVIIASQQKALVVINRDGEVLRSEPLPGKHPQAEGVAITPNNILILSDEATKTRAVLTLYRWRP